MYGPSPPSKWKKRGHQRKPYGPNMRGHYQWKYIAWYMSAFNLDPWEAGAMMGMSRKAVHAALSRIPPGQPFPIWKTTHAKPGPKPKRPKPPPTPPQPPADTLVQFPVLNLERSHDRHPHRRRDR